MRILLSVFVCQPGAGSERGIAWNWATALAEEHEVVALTDVSYRDDIEAELRARPVPNLRFTYVGQSLMGRQGPDRIRYYHHWQTVALAAGRDLHASEPFDLVHHLTFGSHRIPSHLWRLDAPFIWGPVGGGEDAPLRFLRPAAFGWRGWLRELTRRLSNTLVRFDPRVRRTVAGARVVAATTEQTRRALPLGRDTISTVVQAAAVPRAELEALAQRTPSAGPATGLRVMFAGRLLAWKGLALAIDGFARYAEGRPDATFDIYGDGHDRGWLEGYIERAGIADRVHLRGRVPRDELLRAYADHHVFLFPSLHDSGGYVVVEAQAAGLPVICLDLGGPADNVPSGSPSLIPATTPREVEQAIADSLTAFTLDPVAWRAASDTARAHALDPARTTTIAARIAHLHTLALDR